MNFSSRYLRLSEFPWWRDSPKMVMLWWEWLGRLKWYATGLDVSVSFFSTSRRYSRKVVSISCWVFTEDLMSNGNVRQRPKILACHFSLHLVPEGFRSYIREWKKGYCRWQGNPMLIITCWWCILQPAAILANILYLIAKEVRTKKCDHL